MNRHTKGTLGEAAVLFELVKQGYEIFLPYADWAPFDMVVYKDGILKRVSIRYTSLTKNKSSWEVGLRNVSRKKEGLLIKKFNNLECDLLAVYVAPEERVVILDTKNVKNTTSLSIRKRG